MRHLDLFSGIGGFALAARWAGWETIGFSEIDPYASKVLEKNFPGVKNYGDVRKIRGLSADIITGGVPCQPWSKAGSKKGFDDPRWLWPPMFNIIKSTKPSYILVEEVPDFIEMGAADKVFSDLEGKGYTCGAVVLPACAIGAKFRRDRLFIFANLDSKGRKGRADSSSIEGRRKNSEQHPMRLPDRPAEYPSWREIAVPLDGKLPRIPKRVDRIKGLGNSVVPGLVYVLFDFINEAECIT